MKSASLGRLANVKTQVLANNIHNDLDVVHCDFDDDRSTTDGGDFTDENASTISSDESVAYDLEENQEVINVENWRGVARGLADVFKTVQVDMDEEIDVRNWQGVGARMAKAFALELE